VLVALVARMPRDFALAPLRAIEGREVRVSRDVGIDLGQVDAVGRGQGLGKERGAADDAGLVGGPRRLPCGRQRTHDGSAGRLIAGIARDHDVQASRKRPADRLPRAPSHDDGVAERDLLEIGEVGGQPPRQLVVTADDAIARHGDDERADHRGLQTAIGARITGCGS
jgi:hypothetical protein